MKKKIIISGASGFIGKQLVPLLSNHFEILLVGRSDTKLSSIFPNMRNMTYEEYFRSLPDHNIFINLAVVNSDSLLSISEFLAVNRDLCLKLANTSAQKNNSIFINFTSTKVIENKLSKDKTNYVLSKLQAAKELNKMKNKKIISIYLPFVYGNRFSNKLKILNSIPSYLGNKIFSLISSFKPTVHIDKINDFILKINNQTLETSNFIITDLKTDNTIFSLFKRSIDLSFCFILITIGLIPAFLIAFFIKFTSEGPVLFKQDRVGRNEKTFKCYKFRTMKNNTPNLGSHELDDSVVTYIGRFLRKTKLDEIPQVINILKNEMSLVGPRPGLTNQKSLFFSRKKQNIFSIKPGITGYSQIRKIDMQNPNLLAESDNEYLKLLCISIDLKIIFFTFLGFGFGDRLKKNI